MNPFVPRRTQVSGPPWPLPSEAFSLDNPLPPLHSVIGSLTSLARPNPRVSAFQSTDRSINQRPSHTHLLFPQTTRFTPASSSILNHTRITSDADVHPFKPITSRPNSLRRPQYLHINGHSTPPSPSRLVILCFSFLAMASRIDRSSGSFGERTGTLPCADGEQAVARKRLLG